MYNRPTIPDFKSFFSRDFPYGIDPLTSVTDNDISRAMIEAEVVVNETLFISQESFTVGFEYLTAHYLVTALRASSQGVAGRFDFLTSSKSVGSVSVSSAIPDSILANPLYSFYTSTNYGMSYLMMIYAQLVAPIYTVEGATLP